MDMTKKAEIDKDFQAKLIKNIDDDTAIFYGKDKPPMFMVGPRDFIVVRRREELPDGETVVFSIIFFIFFKIDLWIIMKFLSQKE